MEKLRDEILEAQKSRSDLLKWKLIIVSALGAGGLGIAQSIAPKGTPLVLLFVPAVSLYVDILCYHLALRMIVIGTFLKSCAFQNDPALSAPDLLLLQRYESFVNRARSSTHNAFDLEDWALVWSTGVLSLTVMVYGLLDQPSPVHWAFAAVGILGAVMAFLLFRQFKAKAKSLEESVQDPCL